MDGLDLDPTTQAASGAHGDDGMHQAPSSIDSTWANALAEAGLSHFGDDSASKVPPTQAAAHPDNARAASDLIAGATDPATRKVDTGALARQVADAAARDPHKADAAYSAVQAQLQTSDPQAAGHFDQDVVRALSDAAKGTTPGVSRAGGEVLKSNPILIKQWEFTKSARTGEAGTTPGLQKLLQTHGIEEGQVVRPPPAGSLSNSSGVGFQRANNINRDLARDVVAGDYKKQGFPVKKEVPTQGGARRVDVQVQQQAADPRYNRTLEIESKVGRAGLDGETRGQVANDARALAENGEIRGFGHALEGAGRVLGPAAVAADAVQLGRAFYQDGDKIGANTGRTTAGIAGGWGGALVGAEAGGAAGATIGSVVPVVGKAVGGAVGAIVGGVVGGVGGDWAGRRLFDEARSIF